MSRLQASNWYGRRCYWSAVLLLQQWQWTYTFGERYAENSRDCWLQMEER